MSVALTATMERRTTRTPNGEHAESHPISPPSPSKTQHRISSQGGADMHAKGLGITTPSHAWLHDRLSKAGAGAPSAEISDGYTTNPPTYTFSKEYLQRLQESRDRIVELQKRSGSIESLVSGSEDSYTSATSSLGDHKSSSDSLATVVSTVATTPAGGTSIISSFSRAPSWASRVDSAPSTPSRSRSPSPPTNNSGSTKPEDAPYGAVGSTVPTPAQQKWSLPRAKIPSKRLTGNILSENEKSQSSDDHADPLRNSGLPRKKSAPSVSALFKRSISENETADPSKFARPGVPPLPTSFSSDRISSLGSAMFSSARASSIPKLLLSDRTNGHGPAIPKKKDELWTVFRTLDADFAKFASKSLAFKAQAVRCSLLPFLRTYAAHSSNRNLRLEDLDRRANILNKWWTGLIDLLNGQNNQQISGTDRPAILDGISGIMDRPEWRSSPSPFCPLDQRQKAASSPKNQSRASLVSNASDFLAESVHHNVRNIFVQNLTTQMAFVVENMALRLASASLVTFCGKACAYAFVFVPGMADVLVRLWDVHIQSLQRILQDQGIGKFEDMSSVANNIISEFPPALHQLGFSTLTKYMRKLRTPPQLPVGTGNIQWWGPWLDRWSGRESDLFYVFVKHFHILATDFMPADTSKKERLCAPGMLLVHSQILVNIDATIHRQPKQTQQDPAGAPFQTFDDLLADPDAVASPLPIPPTNASRLMAENPLVILIRDFMSERATDHPFARNLLAEAFNDLLETAARGCGLFDHSACYTLLGLLEEILPLLVDFDRLKTSKETMINFEFWKTVWKKMISSENTLTEIRLYSFLYTVWNTVICDSGWKADVCTDLLLEPKFFESRFSHWCPTVRAYFMRLLCWRMARQDGDYSSVDVEVLETLSARLNTTWSHYTFLQVRAQLQCTQAPPTNPCNPVPSRRLRIVRTDNPVTTVRTFLPLRNMLPTENTEKFTPSALKRDSTLAHAEIDVRPGSPFSNSDSEVEQRSRGLGGFIRNWMGTKSRSKSQTPTRSKTPQESVPLRELPKSIVRSSTGDFPEQRQSSSDPPANHADVVEHHKFSFRFALEYHPSAKPLPPMRLSPPRLPAPAQQFLIIYSDKVSTPSSLRGREPTGESKAHAKYCGHALAEWAVVLGECQSFFERRKYEGIPSNKYVETPTLGVEVFRRPS